MQPVPFDVLQRREQQGKGKAKAGRGGPGGAAEGGREVDPREHASRETPLALTTLDRSRAASPPPPSATTPLYGPSATETSRGRGARRPALFAPPPPPQVGIEAHKRPPLGPRTQTPPSWPSAAETVPSQLVGGRAGPDARRLSWREEGEDTQNRSYFDAAYTDAPTTSRTSSPASHEHRTPRQERSLVSMPSIPGDGRSSSAADFLDPGESPAASTGSASSKASWASSFAYLLRDRRSDTRLLHKRNQPVEHLRKRPSPPRRKLPDAARSPSYYKPRIVEDTLAPFQYAPPALSPASPASSSSQLSDPPASSQHDIPTQKPQSPHLERAKDQSKSSRAANSQARGVRANSPISSPALQHVNASERPDFRPTLSQTQPEPSRRGFQIDLPPPHPKFLASGDRSSLGTGLALKVSEQPDSARQEFDETSAPFTPMGVDPTSPRIAHGNHYFRTFGEDTVYEKIRPVILQNALSTQLSTDVAAKSQEAHGDPVTTPNDQTTLHHRSRKRRSLLLSLRNLPLTDSALNIHNSSQNTPSSRPYDPTKSFLAMSRQTRTSNRSDNSASSYFGLGRKRQNSSDHPPLTPYMATHQEDTVTTAGHARDHSSPLSPSSTKRPRLKWSHQVLLEQSKPHEGVESDASALLPAPNLPGTRYRSSDGKEYPATSLTAPGAPNFLPSEMKRIDTPPLKEASPGRNKLRAFKSFFFDPLSLPKDEDRSIGSSSRHSVLLAKRHAPILPKASLQSLANKFSLPGLRHDPSPVSERRESDPLAVTDFQQTPFSQRYGDARRAKQTQMRAYMWDEVLRDDDDSGFGSVGHSFELHIPDHLTTSPLCPLNDKHRSGGKAICPIHGRRKMAVNAFPPKGRVAGRREGSKGGWREPTIVFESSKGGKGNAAVSGNDDGSRRTSHGL